MNSPPTLCADGIVSNEIASAECRYYDLVKRTNGPLGRKKTRKSPITLDLEQR